MDWLSVALIILKFVFGKLPDIIDEYKKSLKDQHYNNEAERINAVVSRLNSAQGRGKLDVIRELEK